jgi:hypothetical protein
MKPWTAGPSHDQLRSESTDRNLGAGAERLQDLSRLDMLHLPEIVQVAAGAGLESVS